MNISIYIYEHIIIIILYHYYVIKESNPPPGYGSQTKAAKYTRDWDLLPAGPTASSLKTQTTARGITLLPSSSLQTEISKL